MVLTRTRHDKVTGVGCIYFDSNATIDKENIFAPSTGPWITAFLAATLCTNVISTCERPYLGLHHAPTDSSAASVSHLLPPFFLSRLALLAFRIWYVGKRVRRMSAHTSVLRPVLRVVLDAGVLYSVSLLAALLCFVAKNRGHYVLIDMVRGILLPFVVVLGLIIGYHPSFTSFLPGSCHFYRIVWHHRSVPCSAATDNRTDHAHHLHYILHGDHPHHHLQNQFPRHHASYIEWIWCSHALPHVAPCRGTRIPDETHGSTYYTVDRNQRAREWEREWEWGNKRGLGKRGRRRYG